MSLTANGQFLTTLGYNNIDQQYVQSSVSPSAYSSVVESSQIFPVPTNREAFCNPYQVQVGEGQYQSYVTNPASADPQTSIMNNNSTMSYTVQTPQVDYQNSYLLAGAEFRPMVPHKAQCYEIPEQVPSGLSYGGHQVFAPVLCQDSVLYTKSLAGDADTPSQILQKKLIQHEPCIHTLTKLESDLEVLKKQSAYHEHEIQNLKQICERKDITIGILKQNLTSQECEIARIKKECKEKDISIEALIYEEADEPTESKEVEMPKVISTNIGKEVEANHFGRSYTDKTSNQITQELARLRLENRDVIRLQAKLCKLELKNGEYERIKGENLSQRQEITRLERKLQLCEKGSVDAIPPRKLSE